MCFRKSLKNQLKSLLFSSDHNSLEIDKIMRRFVRSVFILFIPAVLFGCSSSRPFMPPASYIIPTEGVPVSIRHNLYHEVAPMETLWRISKMYGVNINAIVAANHLKNPTSISAGQKLLIPSVSRIRPIIPVYNTRPWSYIVIHHSATHAGNALTIDGLHQRRGFENGLGYHFLIDNGTLGKKEGQIEVGPRWVKQADGAHCNAAGMNENGIGICMIGNFSENQVSGKQLNSLVFLVNALRRHYRIPTDRVIRHGDVPGKNTECPGRYFPWEELKHRLRMVR